MRYCPFPEIEMIAKRIFDLIVAVVALVGLSPVLLWVYFRVRKELGMPVIFCQERPGMAGKSFNLYKFRSMLDARNTDGEPLSDEQRLTSFGSKLRSTSLDELPELWNVVKGEMSLVGPRPLLKQYLPLYTQEQSRRHEVRPGITGWAQVNGRNAISWEQKFALDVWYVDNRSLLLDLKILYLTILRVVKKEDINADGDATMPPFTGSDMADKNDLNS